MATAVPRIDRREMERSRTDEDLIEACRRGDRGAFRRLFEAHKDRVYSVALHFAGGNAALAADVTQQVFVRLFERIGQYRGEAEFSTWLYRITAHACLDAWRRERRTVALEAASGGAGEIDPGTPESELVRAETERVVQRAVASLRPKIRLAILLRYFLGLTYEEMAAALDCSKGTVASRVSAGHAILGRRLASLRPPPGRGERR
ncbi:MAG: sigma-70 family RNA polymerase sigma factor [Acidobacteria bacterium]|nr:sigma-70 family RNA polymerase sigma factor [Acidobacteriota bacterium]